MLQDIVPLNGYILQNDIIYQKSLIGKLNNGNVILTINEKTILYNLPYENFEYQEF